MRIFSEYSTDFASAINIHNKNQNFSSTTSQIKQRKTMASRSSENVCVSNPFVTAELSIKSIFNFLIKTLTDRRDQLLLELHDIRVDYFSSEETRKKQIKDLDELIENQELIKIEQNKIVKLQKEHVKRLKEEREELERPTPIPIPQFETSRRLELQQLIQTFGAVQEATNSYSSKLHPVKSIGMKGKGKVQLNAPYGVVLNREGNIFITDSDNRRIQVISLEGQFLGEFGKEELKWPHSLALHKNWVFVSDSDLNKVVKYDIQNYKFVYMSKLELCFPLGLAVDENEVFVADGNNNRIVVLGLDLKLIRELGNMELKERVEVKVNMSKVFVVDRSKSYNIHIFSKSGDLLNNIINLGSGIIWIFLCFDQFNNLLISDSWSKIILMYTLEGQLLVHSIGCDYEPTGIALTQDNIIVSADVTNHKINLY